MPISGTVGTKRRESGDAKDMAFSGDLEDDLETGIAAGGEVREDTPAPRTRARLRSTHAEGRPSRASQPPSFHPLQPRRPRRRLPDRRQPHARPETPQTASVDTKSATARAAADDLDSRAPRGRDRLRLLHDLSCERARPDQRTHDLAPHQELNQRPSHPPSTTNVWPCTYAAAGEASQATASATSSSRPQPPAGMRALRSAKRAGSARSGAVKSFAM